METRILAQLRSVGPATLRDFDALGITTVQQLAECQPRALYERLCELTGVRHDPCCEDVFSAALAQARDPELPAEQRDWWTWSAKRKAAGRAQR